MTMYRHGLIVILACVFIGCQPSQFSQSTNYYGPVAPAPDTKVIEFGKFEAGKLPADFMTAVTGPGGPAKWETVHADGILILSTVAPEATGNRYPMCLYMKEDSADVEVAALFMAVTGKIDQAAGLVVRYKDRDNYYSARANALENNVRFYKVQGGKRTQLGSADLPIAAGQWNELRLRAKGERFTILYDGKAVLNVKDKTFAEGGNVGLWTKADSVTRFRWFSILKL